MRFLPKLLIPSVLLSACWATSVDAYDAFNASTQGIVVSGYATSMVSSAPFDRKLLFAAHDDAASFVATQGDIRGVKLESALDHIRHQAPQLNATDAELAQAILTI